MAVMLMLCVIIPKALIDVFVNLDILEMEKIASHLVTMNIRILFSFSLTE